MKVKLLTVALVALTVLSSAGVVTAKQTTNYIPQKTASRTLVIQSVNLGEVIDNKTTPYYIVKLVATLFAPELTPFLDLFDQVYQVDYEFAPYYPINIT